ncbi:biotin--[acetyl-CoA-carboxylase] ligase [Marinospirillum insulare]|uniref:Bifunctional ligase/repressor BirA n=1 Tax=Marinospirillum insulare TaxID=217169 RepID=A0ABQ5ZXQ9_9GAMM|nr:biotin--[acetyl-CoA-carboxylase] ligase [Marinospirillum insulare]GLR63436.1 bifunctional ligase/repressor BirA [Marinospirillum insulare]
MNLYPLIKLLSNGHFHTGTQLGLDLGVSRTAVWKQIQQLPNLGLEIITKKNDGYKLVKPLELLDIEQIQGLFQEHNSSLTLNFYPSLDSTNLELSRRCSDGSGLLNKQLMLVEKQTAGLGRRGRGWYSPYASSLSMSLGFKVEGGANVLQALSLAVAVVIKRELETQGFVGIKLKWPNDLYFNDAKLGGILIELKGDLAGPCSLIVGVGINVYRTSNLPDLDQPISFLDDQQEAIINRSALAANIALAIEKLVDSYPETGFEPYMEEWNQAHLWKGMQSYIMTSKESIPVTLGGVTSTGELEVVYESGEEGLINAGEVSLRPKK